MKKQLAYAGVAVMMASVVGLAFGAGDTTTPETPSAVQVHLVGKVADSTCAVSMNGEGDVRLPTESVNTFDAAGKEGKGAALIQIKLSGCSQNDSAKAHYEGLVVQGATSQDDKYFSDSKTGNLAVKLTNVTQTAVDASAPAAWVAKGHEVKNGQTALVASIPAKATAIPDIWASFEAKMISLAKAEGGDTATASIGFAYDYS